MQHPTDPPSLARRRLLRLAAALPMGLAAAASRAGGAGMSDGRPWHHLEDGRFRNPPGSPERGGSFGDWLAFTWRRVVNPPQAPAIPPGHVLTVEASAAGMAAARDVDSITWLGHAAFLIRVAGRTILTDPYLSERASPFQRFGPRRYAGPALPPERLPPVDLLLLSHNHYDHLDLAALARLPGLAAATAVMPLRVGHYLGDVRPRRLELDWLQRVEVAGIAVTALPAIHFSKRGLFDRNASLWCGFHLEVAGRRLVFAGDTGYGPVFRDLAARVAAPDLALVPIGAYAPEHMMRASHCTPEQAVALGRDLGAHSLCAMHWGAIQLTDEYPFEPPGRFRAAARAGGYADADAWLMAIGETRRLPAVNA